MNNKPPLFRHAATGVALGIAASVAVAACTFSPETFARISGLQPAYIPLLFLMVATAWLCNGLRTRTLSRALGSPLTLKQSLAISLSTEFGIAASPAGMGGGLIRYTLMRRAGFQIHHVASFMAADFTVDAAFFGLVLPVCLAASSKELMRIVPSLDLSLPSPGRTLIGLAVLGAIVFAAVQCGAVRALFRITGMDRRFRLSARFRLIQRRIVSDIRNTTSLIRFLYTHQKKALVANFFFGGAQWICRYGILPVILFAFSRQGHFIPLFFVQGFLFALSLALVIPGGGGGVEVVMAFILSFFIPVALVGVVLILWRFFTYHLYLLVGGAASAWTFGSLNTLFPVQAPEPRG
ncbi:MAG: flippase-like domain-containing protein [Deltaproteobacteria bacterium]